MVNKQQMRNALSEYLANPNTNDFKYIATEILNSKEFIQKIYRKAYKHFFWLPLYLENKDIWNEVLAEQEKIKLGNAFNEFCQTAKLVKPNHKLDLDNLEGKEKAYFKAFYELYSVNQNLVSKLELISDYATFGLARNMDNTQEFNWHVYIQSKETRCNQFAEIATNALEFNNSKGH